MLDLDVYLTQLINSLSQVSPSFDWAMMATSSVGVPLMVIAVAAQWWRQGNRPHDRHVVISAGLAFVLGLAINQVILLFVQRIRPYDAGISNLLIHPSADPSFPSDHATASFAIAFAFLMHGKRALGTAFTMTALLVAFSRVYIGTHYFGDVVGGALTGLLGAMFAITLYRENTRLDRLLTGIF